MNSFLLSSSNILVTAKSIVIPFISLSKIKRANKSNCKSKDRNKQDQDAMQCHHNVHCKCVKVHVQPDNEWQITGPNACRYPANFHGKRFAKRYSSHLNGHGYDTSVIAIHTASLYLFDVGHRRSCKQTPTSWKTKRHSLRVPYTMIAKKQNVKDSLSSICGTIKTKRARIDIMVSHVCFLTRFCS